MRVPKRPRVKIKVTGTACLSLMKGRHPKPRNLFITPFARLLHTKETRPSCPHPARRRPHLTSYLMQSGSAGSTGFSEN